MSMCIHVIILILPCNMKNVLYRHLWHWQLSSKVKQRIKTNGYKKPLGSVTTVIHQTLIGSHGYEVQNSFVTSDWDSVVNT